MQQPPLNEPLKTDDNGKITSTPWNQWFNTVQKTSTSITYASTANTAGVPTQPPGKIGDLHVDAVNNKIYIGVNPQSNSGWVTGTGGGTVGPQGPVGPTGPVGPQGPAGSSGGITPGGTGFAHVTASSLDPTARNPVLASSDFANQGSANMVLFGNASGNPSWNSMTANLSGALALNGSNANVAISFPVQYLSSLYTITATAGNNPTIAVNWNNGNTQEVLLGHTGTATITLANGISGGHYTLIIVQPGGGGDVVSMTISGVKWVAGITPTQTTTGSKKDILVFMYDGVDYLGEMSPNF